MLASVVALLLLPLASQAGCPDQSSCITCVGITSAGFSQCVWCTSNSSCIDPLDNCPLEGADPGPSVVRPTQCTNGGDGKTVFGAVVGGVLGALLLVAIVAFIVVRSRRKKEADQKALRTLTKREERQMRNQRQKEQARRNKEAQRGQGDATRKDRSQMVQRAEEEERLAAASGPRSSASRRASKSAPAPVPERWEVLSKGGLRVRAGPNKDSDKRGILTMGSIIAVTQRKGNWVQHSEGWSMVSDGKKDNPKIFLRLLPDKRRNSTASGDERQERGRSLSREREAKPRSASRAEANERARSRSRGGEDRPREPSAKPGARSGGANLAQWECSNCGQWNPLALSTCSGCSARGRRKSGASSRDYDEV